MTTDCPGHTPHNGSTKFNLNLPFFKFFNLQGCSFPLYRILALRMEFSSGIYIKLDNAKNLSLLDKAIQLI